MDANSVLEDVGWASKPVQKITDGLGSPSYQESRMPLIDHPLGNYRFLPGIAPYSCGVVSVPGFEIVHVTFQRPVPYRDGFERIAQHLAA